MGGRKRSRKQQTRIAFTPLPSSSPAAKDYHQQIKDRAAAVRYDSGSPSPAKRRKVQFSSPANESRLSKTYLPTPNTPVETEDNSITTSQGIHRQLKRKARQQRLDLTIFSSSAAVPSGASASVQDKPPQTHERMPAGASSDDSDVAPVRSAKKRRTGGAGFMSSGSTIKTRGQTLLDLDDVSISQPQSTTTVPGMVSSDSSASEDADEMPTTAGTRKREARSLASVQRSSSPPFEAPSDDDLEVVHVGTRKTRTSQADLGDDDDVIATTTPRRKLLKRSNLISQQDRSDLAEDLDFLEPTSDANTPRRPRDSQNVRKNARMKALDALKRKRLGQQSVEEPEEEAADEDDAAEEEDYQYISSDMEADPAPRSSRAMFQADEEDENFLVDDDEDTLGVPDGLPLEFSKYASMKGKDLFQYAVEWMVQKKINPAFNLTDGLYDLTFKKLNDEVSGLVASKFSSAAWTSDFTVAMRSRPNIAIEDIQGEIENYHCDACNRTKYPATFKIQFKGKPYHLETLDDVEDKEEDDDDSDAASEDSDAVDDKPGYDAQGRRLPPASRVYQVGRFCAANAETAHELTHWKLALYEWVVKWIEGSGYNTPEKLVQRDRMSTKKRRKYANKIVDRMAKEGVIRKLWKEFQDTITRARDFNQTRYRRG